MGITGLIPFIEKASRRANVSEFTGCTVAIDSYCWLHKGAFACADKLVRGEETDIHIKYCMKYVTMLLSRNIKPILVFDGRHLPAKAMTEAKRRESRNISKKRAAELLTLGKTEEARSYMRRSVDITHAMALALIKECRRINVDCVVAPYEADAQLAYLNIKNIAQLVITEDSDLILFGCTKVLFKMDLEGTGTLVETVKLPLVMKCPIERYTFEKFRQMCIMSGCDYLPSLPGIGLAKARQFVTTTLDTNFANALKKLPNFFNKSTLKVTDEYRESFLKAEATFKHQYVYDPLERKMVRLNDADDEDIEEALCVNAGELLDDKIAFQLALGNLDPFTLNKMDDWHPDNRPNEVINIKSSNWKDKSVSSAHPSIWSADFKVHLDDHCPWQRKVKKFEPVTAITQTGPRKKVVVNLVSKYVPETQDESLSIETLSNMYCIEPSKKKKKTDCDNELSEQLTQYTQNEHDIAFANHEPNETSTQKEKSPILENKLRSYKKCLNGNSYSVLKRLSRFPRTLIEEDVVESKFFTNTNDQDSGLSSKSPSQNSMIVEESPERNYNPFKIRPTDAPKVSGADTTEPDSQLEPSEKENSSSEITELNRSTSPILGPSPGRSKGVMLVPDRPMFDINTEDSVIENTYPLERLVTPVDSQSSFGDSPSKGKLDWNSNQSQSTQRSLDSPIRNITNKNGIRRTNCKVPGLKRTISLPANQPTLLNKFGFQKKCLVIDFQLENGGKCPGKPSPPCYGLITMFSFNESSVSI